MYVRYLRILICVMTMSPLTRDAQNKREREGNDGYNLLLMKCEKRMLCCCYGG
jgi:hypothetical protein